MVIPYRERGRVIPNERGIAALKEWVESAPDVGQKGARALHVKSLHTRRGIGAKTLGFFWLDVPFRAAGAAVRAGYQPHLTCPICLALAEHDLSPRGKPRHGPWASPASAATLPGPSNIDSAPAHASLASEVARAGDDSERDREADMGLARRITYQLGKEVITPAGNPVKVLDHQSSATWTTPDGGTVEPADGQRFASIRISYRVGPDPDDRGLIADAFKLELKGGKLVAPLEEFYAEGELQGRYSEEVPPGTVVEGMVYFEIAEDATPLFACFECSRAGEDEESLSVDAGEDADVEGDEYLLLLRWRLTSSGDR
jgi:hypothetical protein